METGELGPTVYVVDDDFSVRAALKKLLKLAQLRSEEFGSIEEFLKVRRPETPNCLILDVRLPGMSGLDFQHQLGKAGIRIPIIFITAQGDSPMTRQAMKAGAVDFLTKPFRKKELLAAVNEALSRDRARRQEDIEISALLSRLEKLTSRENEVLELVIMGMLNKQAADKLGISEATIKIHRRSVMEKMQADSLAELVKMGEKIKALSSR